MKAALKKFVITDDRQEEKAIENATKFLTELGPERVISVHLNCTGDAIVVWYWEANGGAIARDLEHGRIRSMPPVLVMPSTPMPPGTVMCEQK